MGINIAKLKTTCSLAVFDAPLPPALVTALAIGKRPSIPRTWVADAPAAAGQAKLEAGQPEPEGCCPRHAGVTKKTRERHAGVTKKTREIGKK